MNDSKPADKNEEKEFYDMVIRGGHLLNVFKGALKEDRLITYRKDIFNQLVFPTHLILNLFPVSIFQSAWIEFFEYMAYILSFAQKRVVFVSGNKFAASFSTGEGKSELCDHYYDAVKDLFDSDQKSKGLKHMRMFVYCYLSYFFRNYGLKFEKVRYLQKLEFQEQGEMTSYIRMSLEDYILIIGVSYNEDEIAKYAKHCGKEEEFSKADFKSLLAEQFADIVEHMKLINPNFKEAEIEQVKVIENDYLNELAVVYEGEVVPIKKSKQFTVPLKGEDDFTVYINFFLPHNMDLINEYWG
jgi:hypothetical protein